MSPDELRNECKKDHEFDSGTAYARTLICCRAMARHGLIPGSWTQIREVIGKGSANDIQRGLNEFRASMARGHSLFAGVALEDQAEFGEAFKDFVSRALSISDRRHRSNVVEWEQRLSEAELAGAEARKTLEQALVERHAMAERERMQGRKIDELEQAVRDADVEKRQLKELLDQNRAQQEARQQELQKALEEYQKQLDTALDRLEGERKHALRQIEEARTESRKKVELAQLYHKEREKALKRSVDGLEAALLDSRAEASKYRTLFDSETQTTGRLREEASRLQKLLVRDARAKSGGRIPAARGAKKRR